MRGRDGGLAPCGSPVWEVGWVGLTPAPSPGLPPVGAALVEGPTRAALPALSPNMAPAPHLLNAALQFFEGFAIGSAAVDSGVGGQRAVQMALVFSATTPAGIVLGELLSPHTPPPVPLRPNVPLPLPLVDEQLCG